MVVVVKIQSDSRGLSVGYINERGGDLVQGGAQDRADPDCWIRCLAPCLGLRESEEEEEEDEEEGKERQRARKRRDRQARREVTRTLQQKGVVISHGARLDGTGKGQALGEEGGIGRQGDRG